MSIRGNRRRLELRYHLATLLTTHLIVGLAVAVNWHYVSRSPMRVEETIRVYRNGKLRQWKDETLYDYSFGWPWYYQKGPAPKEDDIRPSSGRASGYNSFNRFALFHNVVFWLAAVALSACVTEICSVWYANGARNEMVKNEEHGES